MSITLAKYNCKKYILNENEQVMITSGEQQTQQKQIHNSIISNSTVNSHTLPETNGNNEDNLIAVDETVATNNKTFVSPICKSFKYNSKTYTFPSISGELMTAEAAQTITNKTINSFTGNNNSTISVPSTTTTTPPPNLLALLNSKVTFSVVTTQPGSM